MFDTNETAGVHLEGFAFGMTDGIICFLGIIIGVAQATQDPIMVIIAGIVGGVADAFGNSIGFLISQITEQSIQTHQKENLGQEVRIHTQREVIFSGIFSFIATIIALVLLIGPYVFIADFFVAMLITFLLGVLALFLLGMYVAKISGKNKLKLGLMYAIVGITGSILAFTIGSFLNQVIH
ncbi:MAG: VIT1/CCC1 transporter family protein [Candidatus Hodarchaeales archaeon]|jgi:predicted membrane protein (TIGR00267 family)